MLNQGHRRFRFRRGAPCPRAAAPAMRLLIDGYNLMYALGLMGRRFGPEGFRQVRTRFLNDLAAALDPLEAHQTTVVFDAAEPPDHVPHELRHQGLTVLFAV